MKTIGKPLENGDLPSGKRLQYVYITMERSTMLNGKTHYFDWAMASMSQSVNVYQAGSHGDTMVAKTESPVNRWQTSDYLYGVKHPR